MKTIMTLASTLATGSLLAATPVITENSVTMTQDASTRTVTITYTLEDAPAIVTLDIQTNGVSIGCQHFQNLGGDVNMKVQPDTHTITWQPDVDWGCGPQRMTVKDVKAVVKAWACDAPPPYAVFDLVVPNTVRFYSCEEAVPGGVNENPRYKEDLLVMRRIPAANVTWRMGSNSTEPIDGKSASDYANEFKNAEIPHYVMLTKDYYMGVFEVTQKQISHFPPTTAVPSAPSKAGDHHPIEQYGWNHIRGNGVSWPGDEHNLGAGCPLEALRNLTGVTFDLPTEAQWEFACRAGTGTGLNSGKECDTTDYANANEVAYHYYNTHSSADGHQNVGEKLKNAWGLYDMHGNIGEFCLDWHASGDDYVASFGADYKSGDVVVDPKGPTTGNNRTVRGGSYSNGSRYCRSAARGTTGSGSSRRPYVGFRLCCPAEF